MLICYFIDQYNVYNLKIAFFFYWFLISTDVKAERQSREDRKLSATVIHSILSAPGDPLCSLCTFSADNNLSHKIHASPNLLTWRQVLVYFGSFKRRPGRSWALGIFISLFSFFLFERCNSISSEWARLQHSFCHHHSDKGTVKPAAFLYFTVTKMPWMKHRWQVSLSVTVFTTWAVLKGKSKPFRSIYKSWRAISNQVPSAVMWSHRYLCVAFHSQQQVQPQFSSLLGQVKSFRDIGCRDHSR